MYNAMQESSPGCHIVHYNADWVEVDDLSVEDYGLDNIDDLPDLSVDPDDFILTLFNATKSDKTFFVTIMEQRAFCLDGETEFKPGVCCKDGVEKVCVTFIAVLSKMTVMDLCIIEVDDVMDVNLNSDIKELFLHPDPDYFEEDRVYGFPFPEGGVYRCSQGMKGKLSHFYHTTLHALDFEAPVGTPIVSIGDGEVISILQTNTDTGIDTQNLFFWNSIFIKMDDGIFVEYVHIKTNSCVVNVGDRVTKGQKICESGNIGFCPTPHLHIQCHTESDPNSATIKFAFESGNSYYFPEAGNYYSSKGL